MKKVSIFASIMLAAASLSFTACGGSSDSDSSDSSYESSYSDDSDEDGVLVFNSASDVRSFLNGKTFSADGMNMRFSNNGQSVDINGTNISNNVQISDIGLNDQGVAYATVRVVNPSGITTTMALLAVPGHAQLIDPNDGTVFEY